MKATLTGSLRTLASSGSTLPASAQQPTVLPSRRYPRSPPILPDDCHSDCDSSSSVIDNNCDGGVQGDGFMASGLSFPVYWSNCCSLYRVHLSCCCYFGGSMYLGLQGSIAIGDSKYLKPAQSLLEEVVSVGGKSVHLSNEKYIRRLSPSDKRGSLGLCSELKAELCNNGLALDKQELEAKLSKLISLLEERADISVLGDMRCEKQQQKPEKKEKGRTISITVSDLVMKQCRHVLRHAAAADEERVFCNLLGKSLLNPNDNDDEGLLGYPAMVSRPLDFRTIDLRLAAGAYGGSHEAFLEDVQEHVCIAKLAFVHVWLQ